MILIFQTNFCLFVMRHVRTEPTLPGFNQYCRELMCLAQGHNTMAGSNPGILHSESDAQPLRHCAPYTIFLMKIHLANTIAPDGMQL